MSLAKKVLLIVNPCAGRTKSRAGTFEIVDKFSKNDFNFTIHTTTCQGDATNIVKKELGDHDFVVCCGGDGTLNETINGVMDMPRRVPIGYIPTGTTNDLARSLGIPSEIKQATDLIISGATNDYDIGLFNNRYFSYVASFGAFSKSSYTTSQKLKNKFGHSAYILSGLSEIKDIHNVKMRIEYDGGVIEDKFVFGTVSNSLSVGGMFKFNGEDVKFNDGHFEVLLVRNFKFHQLLPLIRKVQKQQYDGGQIIMFHTNKLKITALEEDVDWTLDGEYGGSHRNVMIHVLERAVEIISPENKLFLPRPAKPDPVVADIADEKEKNEKKLRWRRNKAEKNEFDETAEEVIPVLEIEDIQTETPVTE